MSASHCPSRGTAESLSYSSTNNNNKRRGTELVLDDMNDIKIHHVWLYIHTVRSLGTYLAVGIIVQASLWIVIVT